MLVSGRVTSLVVWLAFWGPVSPCKVGLHICCLQRCDHVDHGLESKVQPLTCFEVKYGYWIDLYRCVYLYLDVDLHILSFKTMCIYKELYNVTCCINIHISCVKIKSIYVYIYTHVVLITYNVTMFSHQTACRTFEQSRKDPWWLWNHQGEACSTPQKNNDFSYRGTKTSWHWCFYIPVYKYKNRYTYVNILI